MKSSRAHSVVGMLILCLSIHAVAAPPSYPLRVRGGGPIKCWSEATKTPSLVKLVVTFERGTRPAGIRLSPGQGSWLDRGLRSEEPARLEYFMHETDAQKIIDYLRSAGNYYTFECYNSGKGYFQVTKAHVESVRID